jgi:hypothetical protein
MWEKINKLFKQLGHRYYGDGGTIHGGYSLDIETYQGKVVGVLFRCQNLPFKQHDVDSYRAKELQYNKFGAPEIHGIELKDKHAVL